MLRLQICYRAFVGHSAYHAFVMAFGVNQRGCAPARLLCAYAVCIAFYTVWRYGLIRTVHYGPVTCNTLRYRQACSSTTFNNFNTTLLGGLLRHYRLLQHWHLHACTAGAERLAGVARTCRAAFCRACLAPACPPTHFTSISIPAGPGIYARTPFP